MTQRIRIQGDEQLLQTFADINDFDDWATPPMKRATEKGWEIVKRYAPARAGSSYVRTKTLERSIDRNVTSSPNGVTAFIFSSGANQGYGDYESFVKVDGFQAEIHNGYWSTDKDDLEEMEPIFMDEISKAAAEVLR